MVKFNPLWTTESCRRQGRRRFGQFVRELYVNLHRKENLKQNKSLESYQN